MNTLSWLIYAADVIPGLSVFCALCAIFGGGAAALCGIVGAYMRDYGGTFGDDKKWQGGKNLQVRGLKIVPVVALFAFVAFLIPARETILLIAAAEMGEQVVKTPEAQEVFGDLKTILKQQLEQLKRSEPKP